MINLFPTNNNKQLIIEKVKNRYFCINKIKMIQMKNNEE
jgi:hypothetical protein